MATHQGEPHRALPALTSAGILTIDLSAIQANWRSIKARLAAHVSAGAGIKADASGLGVEPLGPALYQVACREFFVPFLVEAREARFCLSNDARIIVLGGAQSVEEGEFIERDLTPGLFSLP